MKIEITKELNNIEQNELIKAKRIGYKFIIKDIKINVSNATKINLELENDNNNPIVERDKIIRTLHYFLNNLLDDLKDMIERIAEFLN